MTAPNVGITRVRRAQLSDEVAGQLRAAIMTGQLRPGTFIRLDETASRLGVSITPVREALLKLRGEGMVRLEPHRGHLVMPLNRADVEDVFWLQSVLARELAASSARNITDAEITQLDCLADELAVALQNRDVTNIGDVEFRFHRVFNRPANRSKLAWFLVHAARYLPVAVYAADPQWGDATVDHHRKLVTALRSRDVEEVVALTEWQFDDAARRLTDLLAASGIWD